MPRPKRRLAGEEIKQTTLKLRASVHDKIKIMGGSASFVQAIEKMAEVAWARRQRKIDAKCEMATQSEINLVNQ